ncbi:hypothetical protein [Shewanella sp.]|uniref:hypothetical protein n=1 Tax=Shewanella sp. TaxID=50422 RepID=UPI003A984A33
MSATTTKPSFKLFRRSVNDVVKACPLNGDHKHVVKHAIEETCIKQANTIRALAKA